LILHEERHEFADLYRGDRIDGTSVAKFKIGLKQSNLDDVYEYLLNISHPSSPHYGKLWSVDEVHEKFAPPEESVDIVREWLEGSGIDNVTVRNGWLHFESDIARVEDLLKAEYHEYDHFDDSEIRIGCDQYVQRASSSAMF
jgi:tripeptidyl-peptidase-1